MARGLMDLAHSRGSGAACQRVNHNLGVSRNVLLLVFLVVVGFNLSTTFTK